MRVFHDILRALQADNVRYVLVGGVAVVLHGFARFTKDLRHCSTAVFVRAFL